MSLKFEPASEPLHISVKYLNPNPRPGIIGTGETTECVASRGGLGLEGAWLWELKVFSFYRR